MGALMRAKGQGSHSSGHQGLALHSALKPRVPCVLTEAVSQNSEEIQRDVRGTTRPSSFIHNDLTLENTRMSINNAILQ